MISWIRNGLRNGGLLCLSDNQILQGVHDDKHAAISVLHALESM